MADTEKTLDEIVADAKMDYCERLDEWAREFEAGTTGKGAFPTISELEEGMRKLGSETREIHLRMLSEALSQVDESELVASKKGSGPEGA